MTPQDLASLPLFAGVPNTELAQLIQTCRALRFSRGEVVFREGHNANQALLIVEGSLQASTMTSRGRTVLNTVRSGKLVGESGLLVQAEVRSVTLTAESSIYALELTRRDLAKLQGTEVLAAIQMSILKVTAMRLRRTQDQMNKLVRKKASPKSPTPSKVVAPTKPTGLWRSFLDALGGLA